MVRRVGDRRFRRFVAASAGCHVLAAAMLGFAPSRPAPDLPLVISVDLLPALPSSTASRPAASAPPPAAPEPAAKAPPRPKKIVLPKQAPKAVPTARKLDRPPKRVKPEELDYADALAKLRADAGESEPQRAERMASAEPRPPASGRPGVRVDPAVIRWLVEVKRHVRHGWRNPQEFLNRELETRIEVRLTEAGRVVGEPRVVKSSGDPFWDDNTVAAIMRASPLPPPPEPGRWTFSFTSQDRP